jgi:hypothetical protein
LTARFVFAFATTGLRGLSSWPKLPHDVGMVGTGAGGLLGWTLKFPS